MQHKKLELNSAIETMIAGNDHDATAAATIIAYGATLNAQSIEWSIQSTWRNFPRWLRGFVPGVGNVDLKDERENMVTHEFGTRKERVGYYRIWKKREGLIRFHHYWASDTTTKSDHSRPTDYYLFYAPQDLSPLCVALDCTTPTLRRVEIPIPFTKTKIGVTFIVKRVRLQPIHGTLPVEYKHWQK